MWTPYTEQCVDFKGDLESFPRDSTRPTAATELPPCLSIDGNSNLRTVVLERLCDRSHQSLHFKFILFFQHGCLFCCELYLSNQLAGS